MVDFSFNSEDEYEIAETLSTEVLDIVKEVLNTTLSNYVGEGTLSIDTAYEVKTSVTDDLSDLIFEHFLGNLKVEEEEEEDDE